MATAIGGLVVRDLDGDELRFCVAPDGMLIRDTYNEPLVLIDRDDAKAVGEYLLAWAKGE